MSDDKRDRDPFAYAYWTCALVILALKAAGVVIAPWWAVTAPFWGPVAAIPVAAIIATIVGGGRRGR